MKNRLLILGLLLPLASCVSQKKFKDMAKNYEDELKKSNDCNKSLSDLQLKDDSTLHVTKEQAALIASLAGDTASLGETYRSLSSKYKQTSKDYEYTLANKKELESKNKLQRDEYDAQLKETKRKLNEKEIMLNNREADLQKMQRDLQDRESKVQELSRILNQKDSAVKALKNTISAALLGFKDKGLSVNVKNGKVYVSVEEKLLFQSGKYAVNEQGREALMQLASVLNSDAKQVDIVVEGHTDNKPYISAGAIKDNLDLSVMRATEVSRILTKEGKVDPTRVTAAGRGDTQPIASNETAEGRSKNRRTEIILTPKLSELYKLLDNQ
jgi:chemotaxis protein MotB